MKAKCWLLALTKITITGMAKFVETCSVKLPKYITYDKSLKSLPVKILAIPGNIKYNHKILRAPTVLTFFHFFCLHQIILPPQQKKGAPRIAF